MTMGDAFGPSERRPQLRGVSGWLLFLCITLILLNPVTFVLDLWRFVPFDGISEIVPLIVPLLSMPIVENGFGIIAGVLLYRERPIGVLLAKIFFFIEIGGGVWVMFQGVPSSRLLTIGLPTAWLIYLFRSERVKNTYSRAPADTASDVLR